MQLVTAARLERQPEVVAIAVVQVAAETRRRERLGRSLLGGSQPRVGGNVERIRRGRARRGIGRSDVIAAAVREEDEGRGGAARRDVVALPRRIPREIEAADLVGREELALALLVRPIRLERDVQRVAHRGLKLQVAERVRADRRPGRRVVLVGIRFPGKTEREPIVVRILRELLERHALEIDLRIHVVDARVGGELEITHLGHTLRVRMEALRERLVAADVVAHPVVILLRGEAQECAARITAELTRIQPDKRSLRVERSARELREHRERLPRHIRKISEGAAQRLRGGRADLGRALRDDDTGQVLDVDVAVRLRSAAIRRVTCRDAVHREPELALSKTADVDARRPVVATDRIALGKAHAGQKFNHVDHARGRRLEGDLLFVGKVVGRGRRHRLDDEGVHFGRSVGRRGGCGLRLEQGIHRERNEGGAHVEECLGRLHGSVWEVFNLISVVSVAG